MPANLWQPEQARRRALESPPTPSTERQAGEENDEIARVAAAGASLDMALAGPSVRRLFQWRGTVFVPDLGRRLAAYRRARLHRRRGRSARRDGRELLRAALVLQARRAHSGSDEGDRQGLSREAPRIAPDP